MTDLPPVLLVKPCDRSGLPAKVTFEGDSDGAEQREAAVAFSHALFCSRATRGFDDPLTLQADLATRRPQAGTEEIWIPHVFFFEVLTEPTLVWEKLSLDQFEARFAAPVADGERWAARPEMLQRLLAIAGSRGLYVEAPSVDPHFSFRWVLDHQYMAAEAATEDVVGIDHVSLYVESQDEEATVELLIAALGLIEIPRPSQISIPGRWLQAGRSRIHLNSRSAASDEVDFPGPRPNHICFGIADVDSAESALNAAGISTRRAGSLRDQVWFRLSGTTVELQPLRSG